MVRLKASARSDGYSRSRLFQFHSGSIKSACGGIDESPRDKSFQFHSGSIKRTRGKEIGGRCLKSFNSIVVRLKVLRLIHNEGK